MTRKFKIGDVVQSIARDNVGEVLKIIDIDELDERLPYKCVSTKYCGKFCGTYQYIWKGENTIRKV
jgi:hypothetical protein